MVWLRNFFYTEMYVWWIVASDNCITPWYFGFRRRRRKRQRRSHLFGYFQVCNFIESNNTSFPNIPPNSVVDSILEISVDQKGLISKTYVVVSPLQKPLSIKLQRDWEDELGKVLDDDVWEGALKWVNNNSVSSRLSRIQFKVVHRIYLTNF